MTFPKSIGCTQLSQGCDYGFFGFGQENDQAILTAEAAEVLAPKRPDIVDDGGARSGQPDDLASFQLRQLSNTGHIGRLQKVTPRRIRERAK